MSVSLKKGDSSSLLCLILCVFWLFCQTVAWAQSSIIQESGYDIRNFDKLLKKKIPLGTPQDNLLKYLKEQGFRPSNYDPNVWTHAIMNWREGKCSYEWEVKWEADSNGKIKNLKVLFTDNVIAGGGQCGWVRPYQENPSHPMRNP